MQRQRVRATATTCQINATRPRHVRGGGGAVILGLLVALTIRGIHPPCTPHSHQPTPLTTFNPLLTQPSTHSPHDLQPTPTTTINPLTSQPSTHSQHNHQPTPLITFNPLPTQPSTHSPHNLQPTPNTTINPLPSQPPHSPLHGLPWIHPPLLRSQFPPTTTLFSTHFPLPSTLYRYIISSLLSPHYNNFLRQGDKQQLVGLISV